MIYYFTLPGLGNSDENHWQSHFEKILPNCRRIEQDNWDKPVREAWVDRVEEAVRGIDLSQVVFISHSLGGITLSHWVRTYHKKIKAALIVAPPCVENVSPEYGLESFLPVPKTKLPFSTLLVASSNDPWSSIDQSQKLAENWGSDFVNIGHAGHINSDSGLGMWSQGQRLLNDLLQPLDK
ncbi:RBBP9/YdeN family alpha/beta hydrolase [Saccharicrinis fermentans]|uniref:Putative esterase of the alpha/beta hydrolase fold protein n=1 Tax=Saccharicrinis fermentans DSM 9555 = JCM 21142 TaxID=869213 RepID=W7Y4F5_9BACT|nr:alpha/beta hydrolase [Saccharicrinis fermentans]GAF02982.1 putative esterase of the alpha/beta hydrolase fold protein [Saccharicrinis fermentans DSM 9555 = JCM 21142]